MKYISLLIIISLFTKFADAQKSRAKLIELGLKGRVKQLVVKYKSEGPKYKGEGDGKEVLDFDNKGNQLDKIVYDKDMIKKTVFIYSTGKIIEHEYINDKFFCTNVGVYDNNGNEVEYDEKTSAKVPLKKPKSESQILTKYDANGNKVEEYCDFGNGQLKIKTTFNYNEKNQNVSENRTTYFGEVVQKEKWIYTYDPSGYKIKSECYDKLGKLIQLYTSSYNDFDKYGNWLSSTEIQGLHQMKDDFWLKNIDKRQIIYFQ